MHNFEFNYQLSEISNFARKILSLDKKVMLFYGDIGSGKTTLIKELCEQLGSKSQFSSPTFQIVNEYVYNGGLIYHFDLYRLNHTSELMDLGFDDYIFSNQYCFIEWPELAEEMLTINHIKVKLTSEAESRKALVEVMD